METFAVAEEGRWRAEALKNLYPIVSQEDRLKKKKGASKSWSSPAYGEHEVIIETTEHKALFHELDENALRATFQVYQQRFQAMLRMRGIKYVLLFKNHGRAAGATVEHEHAQIISFPFIPEMIAREAELVKKTKKNGRCWFCNFARPTNSHSWRLVAENKSFAAVLPQFARFPFEVWIVAKRHVQTIAYLSKMEARELMSLLTRVVGAQYSLGYTEYNLAFHNAPKGKDFHFHVEIYPRSNIWGGIELGSGVVVNPYDDQEAAYALKELLF